MTFKIKHFSGSFYTVKYRFRWYHVFFRTVREWRTSWDNPYLNTVDRYLCIYPRLFQYTAAETFVAEYTEFDLRALLATDRATFDVRQAKYRKTWNENKRKSLRVVK